MSDNLFASLMTVGGAAVVTAAVFVALWKLMVNATVERFKRSQLEALEQFKGELRADAAKVTRFEDAQFGAFQDIWDTLADLRVGADRLWDRASGRNVEEFGRRLEAARGVVYRRQLVIDTFHLHRLREAISDFEEFYSGKQGLLDMRAKNPADLGAIEARITENGRLREHYSMVLDDLRGAIRRQSRPRHGAAGNGV